MTFCLNRLLLFLPLWEARAGSEASNSSTRTAAGRASVSVNLSGQNNPNEKQSLEIALEREEISFIAKPEGRIGGAAGEEAAARLVLILRNEAKIRCSKASGGIGFGSPSWSAMSGERSRVANCDPRI